MVDHIHRLGFKAGIYSDAGRNTCGNFWDADFFFRRLGFDFIKVDFCGGDPGQNSGQLRLDERERYTAIRRAVDATGRRDVRLNVCRWAFPGTWVGEVASLWRIAADIAPNWVSVKRIIRANRELIGLNQRVPRLQARFVREEDGVSLYVKAVERLKRGRNTISLANDSAPMPDIDCLRLQRGG